MSFVNHVKKTISGTVSTSVLRLAEALDKRADETGLVPVPVSEIYAETGTSNFDMSPLFRAGLVLAEETPDGRRARIVRSAAKTSPEPTGGVPRTGLETREPRDQNEHLLAVTNSTRITDVYVYAVLMAAITEIGLYAMKTKVPYAKAEKELAAEFLAKKARCSERKARDAANDAVKLGYLVRVDNGKGGRNNQNKATYRAVLPDFG